MYLLRPAYYPGFLLPLTQLDLVRNVATPPNEVPGERVLAVCHSLTSRNFTPSRVSEKKTPVRKTRGKLTSCHRAQTCFLVEQTILLANQPITFESGIGEGLVSSPEEGCTMQLNQRHIPTQKFPEYSCGGEKHTTHRIFPDATF